ncbi:MAG: FAD-binding oxidoreductase [Desulfofustis sp.]|nr:FAD-binding oxidoreductase [Desulfofustis sp.]
MYNHTSEELAREISAFIPAQRICSDEPRRRAYSTDSSMFFRMAGAVVDVIDEQEVVALIAYARARNIGLTFRGSGTSLNGQCSGTGILVRLKGPLWRQLEVHDRGDAISGWAGVIGSEMNEALLPFNRKIGPDPSSLASACFGGILANNAAGGCCTVDQNVYATLRSIRLILHDGTIVDTSDPENVSRFRSTHRKMLGELSLLRQELLSDAELAARIRRKYRIKNTCGYAVNAFVDFDDPLDILTHLLVGSEGTLAFVSRATIGTVPVFRLRAAALIVFPSLTNGIKTVKRWRDSGLANAAELFDRSSLKAIAALPKTPQAVRELGSDGCAVLIETQADDDQTLHANIATLLGAVQDIETIGEPQFHTDPELCESLWAVRRGLFPAIAGTKQPHESVLLEDICFPLDRIEEGCRKFEELFSRFGYNGGLHGHVFHGNFHFAFPVDLSSDEENRKIHRFIEEMVDIVVDLDGSLKAEHGTGYAVAAFVEREWGETIYAVMKRVKQVLDPVNIFNPGVLINDDPRCHTRDLKVSVACHPLLDNCVECGFCEPVCPSKDIGFTPRQRVSVLRHIAWMEQQGRSGIEAWRDTYDRFGTQLCATDAICTTRCPLSIDVAGFTRDRRHAQAGDFAHAVAAKVGSHFELVTRTASHLLSGAGGAQRLLGDDLMYKISAGARKLSRSRLPSWNDQMPRGARKLPRPEKTGIDSVVYVPSCAVRTMGDSLHDPAEPLAEVTVRLLEKAGYAVIIPEDISRLCCGKAFETKGLLDEADAKAAEMEKALLAASSDGELPILCETSPCLARMRKVMDGRLKLYEPIEFTMHFLLSRLKLSRKYRKIAIHPTCSTRLLRLEEPLLQLAEQCADQVVWPRDIQCCGFAGDKGFSHPQLNRSALEHLAERISGCEQGFSTSRTCEIGLSLHGNVPYKNILYMLDACADSSEACSD